MFRAVHRVLADPLRLRVLEALWVRSQSAKELARWVGVSPDRLYYHLRKLEAAGLVEVSGYRELGGGKVERVYSRVAVEPPAEETSPAERAHFLSQVLLTSRADITDACAAQERGADRRVHVVRSIVRLSREHVDEMRARFEEMTAAADDGPDDDGVLVSTLLTLVDLEDRDPAGAEGAHET